MIPDKPHTQTEWTRFLREYILLPEVDEETAVALFLHLADLGVWQGSENDCWNLSSDFHFEIPSEMEQRLLEVSGSEGGFALKYFLRMTPETGISLENYSGEADPSEKQLESNRGLPERPSSNLSNLQIVKKYGRQMGSFIELENVFTAKLLGKHVQQKEARRIFNFVLSRMKPKEKPRAWEQLSRRRHK